MKKVSFKMRILSAVTAVAVLSGVIAVLAQTTKEDKALERLSKDGVLVGDENGDLRLSDNVTRAEFSKMVLETKLLSGLKTEEKKEFLDVSSSHWAYEYIKKMAGAGLLSGYGDGTFGPEDNITLIQAERIALRIYYGFDPENDAECGALALDYGIADGVKALHHEAITRADAANIIYNLIFLYESESYEEDGNFGYIGNYNSAKTSSGGSSSATTALKQESEAVYDMAAPDYIDAGFITQPIEESVIFDTEEYSGEEEGIFKSASLSPLSTFSIDTDSASYSNMRRFILQGIEPKDGSVRTEELINYFTYENEKPKDGDVFGVTTEVGACPWNENNLLARISIQGEELPENNRQPQNLTFLIDVSGSMYSREKLPLVKRSMSLLLEKLDERDRISIVTYASGTSVVLEGATGAEKEKITEAVNSLRARGATAGAAGLTLAYEQAEKFKVDGNNRIILCTDGDFNVGISSESELKSLVEEKRNGGIFLSIMGFGTGNLKDNKLEIMADNGNGSYYYIDNLKEAKKVLVDEMTKTLYTIAKDVKLQVEFNPEKVLKYRLIGYENRMLQTEDFENDAKDAGELGAGSTVTALYEIVPASTQEELPKLRYQTMETSGSDELLCVNIRYKEPQAEESILREYPVSYGVNETLTDDFNFAASVAMLGMVLNDSEYKNGVTYDDVITLADSSRGEDKYGYRGEFVSLVDLLRMIAE